MTTERIIDAAATMLETWARHLQESADLAGDQIRQGDPDGHGIGFLAGCAHAYRETAEALQASADDVRLYLTSLRGANDVQWEFGEGSFPSWSERPSRDRDRAAWTEALVSLGRLDAGRLVAERVAGV